MIDIQPLSDLVMVEVDATKREKAGLLLPKEVQPDLEEGKAVAFGPDLSTVIRREIEMCAGGVIYAAGTMRRRPTSGTGGSSCSFENAI